RYLIVTGVQSCALPIFNDASYIQFHSCQFTAGSGYAGILGGDWPSRNQFQNCTINGRLQLNKGVYSIVNSTLNVSNGQYHVVMKIGRASCRERRQMEDM